MSDKNVIDLYELLPALYRLRDAERGYPLREVLEIISTQADIVKQNIDGLWDDMFIETCADWVIPYVGDLVGNNPLHEVAARHRADVAKTISYRRRKATVPMLEELARDVTGWHAHAVAFFELLGWTQNLNHLRFQQAPVHDVRDPIVFDRVGTVNLRNMDALDRLNEPFDVICHKVDVRPISRTEGWYNIPKIGFFLWRLRHYPLTGITARQASVSHGYHFSTLGNPAPLFNNPEREADPTGLASEVHVPGPIRPGAFHFSSGDYYGEERSLHVVKDGVMTPPASVMCKDLRNWDRPPAGITGVLSGDLSPFPTLSSATPVLGVTIGGEGPHPATLASVPADLIEARSLLEVAIRDAHTSPSFTAAQVVVVGDRLLVLPGITDYPVAFEATAADSTTVAQLALDSAQVQQARGVLSGDLSPFPTLSSATPVVGVTIGGERPHPATLASVPADLTEARSLLEVAIRDAHTSPSFTAAQVVVVGERLLVLPGTPGESVALELTATDSTTVTELALSNKVAIDVRQGRIAFAVGDEPKSKNNLTVSYNYGFSANMGSGPYDRRRQGLQPDQLAPIGPDTVADPEALDVLFSVPSNGLDTIADALNRWGQEAHPTKAVIQIEDNRTYEVELTINMVAGDELVIQADNGLRPTLIGDVTVTGGGQDTRLALNGLLISGGFHLQGRLEELSIAHCTLVPGRSLDEDGWPLELGSSSVIVDGGNDRLKVEIDHSILGSLRLPAEIGELRVQDSIIDSATRDRSARLIPALISGNLSSVSLSSDTPAVNVTIGREGPHRAVFPADVPKPATRAPARDQLQAAIRNAHGSQAFTDAHVIAVDNRLAVLPGVAEVVAIEAAGADPTASELKLDRPSARQVYALVTGALPPSFTLSSTSPRVNVTIGDEGPHTAVFSGVPGSPAPARNQLQAAIRSAHDSQAFKDALVGSTEDNRLVVLPGTDGVAVTFSRAPNDETTLKELALESERTAIAGSDGGELPGPPATLERTTIFGKVHVKELILASEVIFNDPVVSERRQAGCVRFSYVPEGSRTPRRYRCQPDLALEGVIDDRARQASIRARLTPSFTSVHYGHPAYTQLGLT